MTSLNPKTLEFVENMGVTWERLGTARTSGRIFGLLLVAERALSLDEIAETLQVSKASVSTNTRLAEEKGLVRRISLPGDRRVYYEITHGAWESALEVAIANTRLMIGLAEEGLAALEPSNTEGRVRLEEMRTFYDLFRSEMEEMRPRLHTKIDHTGKTAR